MVKTEEHSKPFKISSSTDYRGTLYIGGAIAPGFDERFSSETGKFRNINRPINVIRLEEKTVIEAATSDKAVTSEQSVVESQLPADSEHQPPV